MAHLAMWDRMVCRVLWSWRSLGDGTVVAIMGHSKSRCAQWSFAVGSISVLGAVLSLERVETVAMKVRGWSWFRIWVSMRHAVSQLVFEEGSKGIRIRSNGGRLRGDVVAAAVPVLPVPDVSLMSSSDTFSKQK